jgi:hypothetical protein
MAESNAAADVECSESFLIFMTTDFRLDIEWGLSQNEQRFEIAGEFINHENGLYTLNFADHTLVHSNVLQSNRLHRCPVPADRNGELLLSRDLEAPVIDTADIPIACFPMEIVWANWRARLQPYFTSLSATRNH